MAIPSEQATSEMVTRAPSKAAHELLSGRFKHVLAEHGKAFAQVKQLGMRLDGQPCSEREPRSGVPAYSLEREGMAAGYAALRAIVEREQLLGNDARANDLADAMAALDAINPASPEWVPTFLQVSELVEAHLIEAEPGVASDDDHCLVAAC